MITQRYGGPWQEIRALIATWLFGLAMKIHADSTLDLASTITAITQPESSDEFTGAGCCPEEDGYLICCCPRCTHARSMHPHIAIHEAHPTQPW